LTSEKKLVVWKENANNETWKPIFLVQIKEGDSALEISAVISHFLFYGKVLCSIKAHFVAEP
jgi:hypothetical protein